MTVSHFDLNDGFESGSYRQRIRTAAGEQTAPPPLTICTTQCGSFSTMMESGSPTYPRGSSEVPQSPATASRGVLSRWSACRSCCLMGRSPSDCRPSSTVRISVICGDGQYRASQRYRFHNLQHRGSRSGRPAALDRDLPRQPQRSLLSGRAQHDYRPNGMCRMFATCATRVWSTRSPYCWATARRIG